MQRPILTFRNEAAAQKLATEVDANATVYTEKAGDTELYVVKADIPQTDEILAAAESVPATDIVVCPECGSRNVEFPEKPENSPTMKAVHKMIAPDDDNCFCNKCNYVWSA